MNIVAFMLTVFAAGMALGKYINLPDDELEYLKGQNAGLEYCEKIIGDRIEPPKGK